MQGKFHHGLHMSLEPPVAEVEGCCWISIRSFLSGICLGLEWHSIKDLERPFSCWWVLGRWASTEWYFGIFNGGWRSENFIKRLSECSSSRSLLYWLGGENGCFRESFFIEKSRGFFKSICWCRISMNLRECSLSKSLFVMTVNGVWMAFTAEDGGRKLWRSEVEVTSESKAGLGESEVVVEEGLGSGDRSRVTAVNALPLLLETTTGESEVVDTWLSGKSGRCCEFGSRRASSPEGSLLGMSCRVCSLADAVLLLTSSGVRSCWTGGGAICCTQDVRCATNLWRTPASTPPAAPAFMYRLTSPAHSLKPLRNFCITPGSAVTAMDICWRWMVCKCFTVISKISAFSSLECLAGCKRNWHVTNLNRLLFCYMFISFVELITQPAVMGQLFCGRTIWSRVRVCEGGP